jgi:putative ABC transport system substrate-binding protein
MRRREFIQLTGAAISWPIAARAQQRERVWRIGVLMLYSQADPEGRVRAVAFQQGLGQRGWISGRNLQIDYHWGIGDDGWIRSAVAELLSTAPDVILANGGPAMRPVQQATRTVPVIFIGGSDPVADGFVQSLAHPGGNMTGFTTLESSVGGKLLELLKEIAPGMIRVAIMVSPDTPGSVRLVQSAAASAQRFAMEAITIRVREAAEIEAAMMWLGRELGSGLIVPLNPSMNEHRRLMVELAARYHLPTMYTQRAAVTEGGLISYGIDVSELFREAAGYADRIFRGEKPAELPVQQPTKFELVINLKTAKALGLSVPVALQAGADEVIE